MFTGKMVHDTCFEMITLKIAPLKCHSLTKTVKCMYMYMYMAGL